MEWTVCVNVRTCSCRDFNKLPLQMGGSDSERLVSSAENRAAVGALATSHRSASMN